MTGQEYRVWKKSVSRNAGQWTVDRVHNGVGHDLFVIVARPDEPQKGLYIEVERGGQWEAGRFEDAELPHIGAARFITEAKGSAESFGEAITHLADRLGFSFLREFARAAETGNPPAP
jgi:hypothetical protein